MKKSKECIKDAMNHIINDDSLMDKLLKIASNLVLKTMEEQHKVSIQEVQDLISAEQDHIALSKKKIKVFELQIEALNSQYKVDLEKYKEL